MKLSLIVGLLTIAGFAHAQKNNPFSIGLKSTGYFIDKTFRAIATPQISWQKDKHTFGLGPAIMFATEIAASNKNFPKLVGLQGTYLFYPNGNDKKANLFLFNEINLQRIKDKWTSVAWDINSQSYKSYKYVNREYIIQDMGGYGIELLFGKRLSLRQAVGIGFYYSVQDGDEETADAPEIEDQNGNGYKPFGLSWGINLEMSFKL